MWMESLFSHPKPIIGMVHLDCLPGAAGYDTSSGLSKVIDHAKSDYENLVSGGIDGVIFCNENDKPYAKDIGKETVAAMTAVVLSVMAGGSAVPFGIDMQWDPFASLAVANATGAHFIRGITCGTFCGDLGLLAPDTARIIKYRNELGANHIKIITNLMPEFSRSIDPRPVSLIAQTVTKSAMVDAICVSGVMAGQAAPYQQLREIKEAVGQFPVVANTGVNFDTIASIFEIADACIVATCLKENGSPGGRIELQRVKRLIELSGKER